ncbi:hypothetical protein [Alteribacter natronophilus]|uniref:hypothetical protein n=1 Tax=Alteribacter natronophilus TaxID=2583810 RepID=UPI00110ED3EF|nr:hypothetical protein [Alteribacter natronophilus]TMW72384.1 hypothetical protein FGB90_09270 [Alteribacter natronophilus]
MTKAARLLAVTQTLHHNVQRKPDDDEREVYIETLADLLHEREEVLAGMQGTVAPGEEEALLRQAIVLNGEIEGRLKEDLADIKIEMNRLKVKRETGRRYENPYTAAQVDGAFFDRRN